MNDTIIIALVAVAYHLRLGAIKDAISDRALAQRNPDLRVGWAPWHYVGWLHRDLAQLVLYIIAGSAFLSGWLAWSTWLVFHGLINLALHVAIYAWALDNRRRFTWGQGKPAWFRAWEKFLRLIVSNKSNK